MGASTERPAPRRGEARRPNELLSRARSACGLTQHELAEAVMVAHRQLFGREAAVDANYVSKLERGVIGRPHRRYREAFRAALNAQTDAYLGFDNYPRCAGATQVAKEVDTVRRTEFLRLAAGLGVGAALGDPVRLAASSGRLGAGDVELIREVTIASRRLRGMYGGAACSVGVAGQVKWAAGLLNRPCSASVRRDVHAAVGALASMAGWTEVDAGNPLAAHAHHELAMHCAEEFGSWGLRAEVLKDMGLAALYRGDPDEALSLIELGHVRADRLPLASGVLVGAAHARALAAAGRRDQAADRLRGAEDQIYTDSGRTSAADNSDHGSYFAEATALDQSYEIALAAVDVAVHDCGQLRHALPRLHRVLSAPDLPVVRQAKLTAQLADLQLRSGDIEAGLAAADRAIALSTGLWSSALAANLQRLAGSLARRPDPPSRERAHQIEASLAGETRI